jgi:hypothetical protein
LQQKVISVGFEISSLLSKDVPYRSNLFVLNPKVTVFLAQIVFCWQILLEILPDVLVQFKRARARLLSMVLCVRKVDRFGRLLTEKLRQYSVLHRLRLIYRVSARQRLRVRRCLGETHHPIRDSDEGTCVSLFRLLNACDRG